MILCERDFTEQFYLIFLFCVLNSDILPHIVGLKYDTSMKDAAQTRDSSKLQTTRDGVL